jgi:pimeloyl-ACP methyl ester carboxylesterase
MLHVVERGTRGPTLVFLPGVGGTTRYWDSGVAPLASDSRLLLVDPLGFGRSPKPRTTYSVERHVAELRRVLERMLLKPNTVVPGVQLPTTGWCSRSRGGDRAMLRAARSRRRYTSSSYPAGRTLELRPRIWMP